MLSPSDWWMIGPMDFVLLGLGTWRLTSLLVEEDGPWDIFARLRHRVGVRYSENSQPFGKNVIAEAFTCMWCASVWTAAVCSLGYLISPSLTRLLLFPLALSALCVGIERLVRHE